MFNKIKEKASLYDGPEKDLIMDILNDDKCFYKMPIDDTYNILKLIGISEKSINKVVIELLKGEA